MTKKFVNTRGPIPVEILPHSHFEYLGSNPTWLGKEQPDPEGYVTQFLTPFDHLPIVTLFINKALMSQNP